MGFTVASNGFASWCKRKIKQGKMGFHGCQGAPSTRKMGVWVLSIPTSWHPPEGRNPMLVLPSAWSRLASEDPCRASLATRVTRRMPKSCSANQEGVETANGIRSIPLVPLSSSNLPIGHLAALSCLGPIGVALAKWLQLYYREPQQELGSPWGKGTHNGSP